MADIVITGANEGIGFYLAGRLLSDGHRVAVLDLAVDRLSEWAKEYPGRLLAFPCDVRNPEGVEQAVAQAAGQFGGLDAAIHNACKCTFEQMESTAEQTYRDVFDVNYFGALHLARAALPYIRAGGRVIFTSSGVGVMGFNGISPYASSKGAVEALAKCLGLEYRAKEITFHIFHPPLTKTASAAPLPVPKEFMAEPKAVGEGLAKRMFQKKFIICHSTMQSVQTRLMYLFPLAMGRKMSTMLGRLAASETEKAR